MDTYPDEPAKVAVLATMPVSPTGWTDLAEVRLVGRRWLRQR
ncbi:MAG TPA: hypothetical protein VFQ77_22560 [Pseudonocardiaceae bacterium]|jgi:hypothetical protein|nr:hypothetical protein [Pseudonocardiaceae bacterium]